MKNVFVVMAGLVASVGAFAFQPQFQIDYTNHAWGYDNKGCLVDSEGNVYKYAYGHSSDGKGLVAAGKMSDADLKFALELTDKIASSGSFTQRNAAFDAGSTTWEATGQFGQHVTLKRTGDFEGKHSSELTDTLVTLLNGVCVQ